MPSVPNHEQALQQIVALKKEVSELRAKLASQEEDYHKSEGEMHAEVFLRIKLKHVDELIFKQKH